MAFFKKKEAQAATVETAPVEQTETTEEKPKPRKFEYDAPSISVNLEHFLKILDRNNVDYTTAVAEEYQGKLLSIGLKKEDILVICGDFVFIFDAEEFDGKRWLKSMRAMPKE